MVTTIYYSCHRTARTTKTGIQWKSYEKNRLGFTLLFLQFSFLFFNLMKDGNDISSHRHNSVKQTDRQLNKINKYKFI